MFDNVVPLDNLILHDFRILIKRIFFIMSFQTFSLAEWPEIEMRLPKRF